VQTNANSRHYIPFSNLSSNIGAAKSRPLRGDVIGESRDSLTNEMRACETKPRERALLGLFYAYFIVTDESY
jgi:hypothetical protein